MAENEEQDWRLIHNEAWELRQEGKFQEAQERYYKALEIYPNHASYHNLGETYSDMGDREKAIFYFNKSLALNPEYALAHNNKAFSLYVLKRYEEALESINKALKFKSQDSIYNATKAEILFAMGDTEGFYKAFEISIHLGVDPNILDPAIKEKYGHTRRYQIIIGALGEEEINSPVLQEICKKIESWEASQIKEAIALLKEHKEFRKVVEDRYGEIYRNLGGKTLRSLGGFPSRWDKLNTIKKCNVLTYWPVSVKFPIPRLDLSGTKRVDSWRDSHYGQQIEKFPDNLKKIKGIRMVYLMHQQLKVVPDFIYEMTDLEVLSLYDNDIEQISDKLLNLKKLKTLNLSYNYGLKQIPDIGQLKELEELFLKYTDITELSDAFFALKHLKLIDTSSSDLDRETKIIKRIMTTFPDAEFISNTKKTVALEDNVNADEYKGKEKIRFREFNINYLPKSLFMADVVKELEIDCYSLKELPDTFDKLQTLEVLKLDVGKEVATLPPSIMKLKNLKELHIEGWEIRTLPENLGAITTLEKLHLRCTNLSQIPDSVYTLKSLTHLEIEGSNTSIISAAIASLTNLQTLKLQDINRLTIDAAVGKLTQLQEVAIKIRNAESFTGIYNFPNTLKKLKFDYDKRRSSTPGYELSIGRLLEKLPQLSTLELDDVDFVDDAHEIAENHTLTELAIDGKTTVFPKGFGNLKALKKLRIFNSQMERFDTSLYACTNLEYCRITNTKFTTIPEGIAALQKLTWFGFESTQIESIPEDIFELQQLKRLILGESPLFKNKSFKAKIKRKIKGLKVEKSWY
ncbi:tetratricopeptide repeat protein [uncultured Kordia sp.]|uniref:leucine-rich repeat domain-containing protein n=1 Tax=uncultured Kordia sp. TaxID=507699 RepID=UPI002629B7DB|nr:tetratricopeptide repeat protein [uncultured Kordia sp.]